MLGNLNLIPKQKLHQSCENGLCSIEKRDNANSTGRNESTLGLKLVSNASILRSYLCIMSDHQFQVKSHQSMVWGDEMTIKFSQFLCLDISCKVK